MIIPPFARQRSQIRALGPDAPSTNSEFERPVPSKTCQRVLGITGTLGAGKGTIVALLTEGERYRHYSARAFLIERLRAQGLPINRDTMTTMANELRAANHPAYIVEQLHAQAVEEGRDCIIESIRTVGEVELLRKLGNFYLLAVDADPRLRYERAFARGSETDRVSFETFLADEAREMQSADPTKQNLAECIRRADFRFENNGTPEELYQQVRDALASLPRPGPTA